MGADPFSTAFLGSLLVPKKPKVPKAPPPPKVEDKSVQDAAAEARRRAVSARGFRSTILTDMMAGSGLKGKLGE